MCDPQAKPVGINCVVQQSVDAEPLGSNPVNAAELQERCVRTLCMRRAKQCSGFECNKCRRGTGGCQTALGCVLGTWKAGIYTALCVFQVDKETNTESLAQSSTVVRPKDKRAANPPQTQFVRGSTIIRSKTFSPGPQSQYVCRVRKMKP